MPDTPTESEMPGRVLALDYGSRRIGLAISDETRLIAQPVAGLANRGIDDLVERLADIIRGREVTLLVVGLPVNMDDTLGPKAREATELAARLRARLDVEVETFDERLSTVQALWVAREAGLTRKKRRNRLDSMAAQAFLQTCLDRKRREATPEAETPPRPDP